MAEHLVSLKRTSGGDEAVEPSEDFFPHSMFLDNEDIEKLGAGSAKLGDEFPMAVMVRVTSVSSQEDDDSGKHDSVTLSFLEGALGPSSSKSQADRIFGGEDDGGG